MLLDLLRWAHKRPSLIKRFFDLMRWHEGVHEICPAWCPCDGSELPDWDVLPLPLAA